MTRTREEIKALAEKIVNGLIIDLQVTFPELKRGFKKTARSLWLKFIDGEGKVLQQILQNKFGCSD